LTSREFFVGCRFASTFKIEFVMKSIDLQMSVNGTNWFKSWILSLCSKDDFDLINSLGRWFVHLLKRHDFAHTRLMLDNNSNEYQLHSFDFKI
jgi:hypothetical protein